MILPQTSETFFSKIISVFSLDFFHSEKRFPDSEKVCVLKRKVAKMRFLQLLAPIHRPFKHFFVSKMSNSDSPHVFTPRGSFPEKILKIFSRGWPPIV
jgi:hypothetical protein